MYQGILSIIACFWKYDYVKTNKYTESRMFMILPIGGQHS